MLNRLRFKGWSIFGEELKTVLPAQHGDDMFMDEWRNVSCGDVEWSKACECAEHAKNIKSSILVGHASRLLMFRKAQMKGQLGFLLEGRLPRLHNTLAWRIPERLF